MSLPKTKAFLGLPRDSRKGGELYIGFLRGLHVYTCRRVREQSGETPQEPAKSRNRTKKLPEQAETWLREQLSKGVLG